MISQENTNQRELAPKASRRIWIEPGVRNWWIIAIAVVVVMLVLLADQIRTSRTGRYRLDNWMLVSGKIERIKDSSRPTYRVLPSELPTLPAKLSYMGKDGLTHNLDGFLEGQKVAVSPGMSIPILIDPAEPTHWTDRVQFDPLEIYMAPLLLCPFPIVLIGIALWQRKKYIDLWKTGVSTMGRIVNLKNSAVAPLSYTAKCAVELSRTTPVVTVTVPRDLGKLAVNDHLPLIVSLKNSRTAIVPSLYE